MGKRPRKVRCPECWSLMVYLHYFRQGIVEGKIYGCKFCNLRLMVLKK